VATALPPFAGSVAATCLLIQTCQGPEMKMLETVRHSEEGAIFSEGGSTACDADLSKFSDSCLHSCRRTEEIKFGNKPITRKPIQNL